MNGKESIMQWQLLPNGPVCHGGKVNVQSMAVGKNVRSAPPSISGCGLKGIP